MNQNIQITDQKPGSLSIRLTDPSMLDLSLFSASTRTDWTLSCLISDEHRGEIIYSTEQLVPLADFLEQTPFTRQEAYQFLGNLLEKMVFAGRSSALLLDVQCIYASPCGDAFWFAPLPVRLDCWSVFQKDTRDCLEHIAESLQVEGVYEIYGYISCMLRRQDASLPEILCGLQDLESQFCKKSFLQKLKPAEPYRRKVPVTGRFQLQKALQTRQNQLEAMEPRPGLEAQQTLLSGMDPGTGQQPAASSVHLMQSTTASGPSFSQTVLPGQPLKTEVIEMPETGCGSLEIGGQVYELRFGSAEIGRHVSCTICLDDPSVSLHHARITSENGRSYLSSLASTNGTFLNDRKVIRRMRLREGMVLRFGNATGVFHE